MATTLQVRDKAFRDFLIAVGENILPTYAF